MWGNFTPHHLQMLPELSVPLTALCTHMPVQPTASSPENVRVMGDMILGAPLLLSLPFPPSLGVQNHFDPWGYPTCFPDESEDWGGGCNLGAPHNINRVMVVITAMFSSTSETSQARTRTKTCVLLKEVNTALNVVEGEITEEGAPHFWKVGSHTWPCSGTTPGGAWSETMWCWMFYLGFHRQSLSSDLWTHLLGPEPHIIAPQRQPSFFLRLPPANMKDVLIAWLMASILNHKVFLTKACALYF